MGEAHLDECCHCQGCAGKYTLLRDEENPRWTIFERRLPCCGCGIGWSSFLLGFLCPLIWYFATTLYCCKYYNKDPRERPGLAASAVAALIFTVLALIALSVALIIYI
ncbi:uncharacterized protein [Zea mays]|uniref:uncharacterized protein LOC103649661 n=1 Tax=Zea mays TaxID=4577 RepID=UPI0002217587|nr:uncharacterized protein LOC103649661 [Zea mays]NP_001361319.1 uncharacterized protein LOC103649661 [Zea mays]XP_035821941.1 uncharacterized protein LOC103649661 isoform X1 [Zea mays]|eukprot:XP_020405599.1 uncharacterized protein LOC103649661 isoform X1 [Zea mays]